jgi:hypothetical protein
MRPEQSPRIIPYIHITRRVLEVLLSGWEGTRPERKACSRLYDMLPQIVSCSTYALGFDVEA